MERLHPALAHFPIALVLTSLLFDALAYALRRPSLYVVGFWNLVLGVIGAYLSFWSGNLSERRLIEGSIPETLMGTHREAALLALVIFTVLLLARIAFRRWGARRSRAERGSTDSELMSRAERGSTDSELMSRAERGSIVSDSIPRAARRRRLDERLVPVYLLLALIGGVFLARTAHTGNRLVFEAAAGVMPAEYPPVAMLPEGGASRQPVWGLGISENPSYTLARRLSPSAARVRARLYLRTLAPGRPLIRAQSGCRVMQLPLLHRDQPVAGVAVDLVSGRLVPRNQIRCSRDESLDLRQAVLRASARVRELQVGRAAWLGGHGAYWNVPILSDGKMVDILRIDMSDGALVPLTVREASPP